MSQRFTAANVASHNKADNLYIIVDEDVYDLTKFQDDHPGGKKSEYPQGTVCFSSLTSFQSSSAWQARMRQSNFGSITTRASSKSIKNSFKSARWTQKPLRQLLRQRLQRRRRKSSNLLLNPGWLHLCQHPRRPRKLKRLNSLAILFHMRTRPGTKLWVGQNTCKRLRLTKLIVPLSLLQRVPRSPSRRSSTMDGGPGHTQRHRVGRSKKGAR
jgi:hypothetical protein